MNKLFSFGTNVLRSNLTSLHNPYKLTYAITYRCNSRCTICNIWKQKNFNELPLADIKMFFLKNNYFNWIDLTGGEVFLKPDLIDIIKVILKTQKHLYLLHIPTNGILTNKIVHDVKTILSLHPNKFIMSLSLDGPPELHNKLRGIKNNWNQTVATYKDLKKLTSNSFECYFGMTLSDYNYNYIEETYASLKNTIPELTRNDLHFNIAHYSDHYYGNSQTSIGKSTDIAHKLIEFNKKKQLRCNNVYLMEKIFQSLIPYYINTHKTPIPCKSLESSLFLSPDGTIYPCSTWNFPLENIKTIDFDLIRFWRSKNVVKTRHIINLKNCPNCWTPCEAYQSIMGNLINTNVLQNIIKR